LTKRRRHATGKKQETRSNGLPSSVPSVVCELSNDNAKAAVVVAAAAHSAAPGDAAADR